MDDSYAAGLIDGEGYIGISHTQADTYTIRVAVSMVTKTTSILTQLQQRYGGRMDNQPPQGPNNAAKVRWTVEGAEASACLERVSPLLILKVGQAQLCLTLYSQIQANKTAKGRKHWDDDLRAQGEIAKRRIQELNSRGPEQPTPTLPIGKPVAVYRWGAWWEPEDSLFGPVEFTDSLPTCGRMVAGHVYAAPTPNWPMSFSSPLLPTPTTRDFKDNRIRREPHRPDAVDTLSRALSGLL